MSLDQLIQLALFFAVLLPFLLGLHFDNIKRWTRLAVRLEDMDNCQDKMNKTQKRMERRQKKVRNRVADIEEKFPVYHNRRKDDQT